MTVCADSSFFLSLYLQDGHSRRAAAALNKAGEPLVVTPLNELEIVNGIQLRIFRKELTLTEARGACAEFEADLVAGTFVRTPLSAEIFGAAERLARKHSAIIGARSLDILHIASALELGADVFLTFDRTQNHLAATAGLKTL